MRSERLGGPSDAVAKIANPRRTPSRPRRQGRCGTVARDDVPGISENPVDGSERRGHSQLQPQPAAVIDSYELVNPTTRTPIKGPHRASTHRRAAGFSVPSMCGGAAFFAGPSHNILRPKKQRRELTRPEWHATCIIIWASASRRHGPALAELVRDGRESTCRRNRAHVNISKSCRRGMATIARHGILQGSHHQGAKATGVARRSRHRVG